MRTDPKKTVLGVAVLFSAIVLSNLLIFRLFFKGENPGTVVYLYFVARNTFFAASLLAAVLVVTTLLQHRLHDSDLEPLYLEKRRNAILAGALLCPLFAYIDRDVLFFVHGIVLDGAADVSRLWFPMGRADGFLASFGLLPALLIAAFAEELFRSYMLVHIGRVAGMTAAVLVSSFLFALSHVFAPFDLVTLFPLFVSGLFYAGLILLFKSLWPAVFTHCLSNLMALIAITHRADFMNRGVTALDAGTFPFSCF
jgi:membrane protease YdiL (CAAX protease family)